MAWSNVRSFVFFFLGILSTPCLAQDSCPTELANQAKNENRTNGTGWRNPVPRYTFRSGDRYLILEFLYDGMTRFEVSEVSTPPALDEAIFTSPMIARTDFPGAHVQRNGNRFETGTQIITVNPQNLCITLEDKVRRRGLTTICADNMKNEYKTLSIDPFETAHIYGLGQYPTNPGSADGDWVGRVWEPGPMGNATRFIAGGIPSYSQFPIMYSLGKDGHNYGLFLDVPYKQRWDFSQYGQWWKADMWGDEIRGYLISGTNLPEIRERFMDLVGRPLVPPKKAMGFWMSEFGYRSWDEVASVVRRLRERNFPLDGMALDLEWFGNTFNDANSSKMGSLTFDQGRFPNAQTKITEYRAQGIDLMPIEQSYIHHTLPEHGMMGDRGFLAKDHFNGPPTFINVNPWWGRGGLIDWTDPKAGAFWHDKKRMPLIGMGINYHWTDLGEPEMYNGWAVYHGIAPNRHKHGDIHNVYNLMWLKSINDGYHRHGIRERHYLMSRSGTAGIQRFGAGMWSGDVGANMGYLAMHVNNHMHMSFSGIDYYSSDVGGFFRWSLDGNLDELYTQWFAMACMINSPVRPHVWNQGQGHRNLPTNTGDADSNYENLKLRYELTPYYYTLAHRANRAGQPVFPPMVYYYQWDPNVRKMGNQIMIGPDLITGIAAKYGETERNVYLPKGRWFDYHSNEAFGSHGQFLENVPLYRFGKFKLPLFAGAGAIIPKMKMDDKTMNLLGQRKDGGRLDDLVVRVYPDGQESSFDLIEDDGVTTDYQRGAVRTTNLWQKHEGDTAKLVVRAANGSYQNAPTYRRVIAEFVVADANAQSVKIMGRDAHQAHSFDEFDRHNGPVFWNPGRNIILAKSEVRDVHQETYFEVKLRHTPPHGTLYFVCREGHTVPGEAIYVTGDLPQLGNWDTNKALKLSALPYPAWTGMVDNVALNKNVTWKCFKRRESGGEVLKWEDGPNHTSRAESVYPIKSEGRVY